MKENPKYSRDEIDGHFHSICPTAIIHLAKIHREGDLHYGESNWTNVDDLQRFYLDTINHLKRHLELYCSGDRSEDHMAKVMWGAAALIHHDTKCQHQYSFVPKKLDI